MRTIGSRADVLQIFDSWAGVLSETELERWSLDPIIKIIERVKRSHPDKPVIVFPRGAGVAYINYVSRDEINCVSLDSSVPLKWVKESPLGISIMTIGLIWR